MRGSVSWVGIVVVLLLWVGLLTLAGRYIGEHWLMTLGGEVVAWIGAWLGSILGLIHVLITLMLKRRAT